MEAQKSTRSLTRDEFDALLDRKMQVASSSAAQAGQLAASAVTFVGRMDVTAAYDTAQNATENNLSISGSAKALTKAGAKVLGGPIVNGALTAASVAEYAYQYYLAHRNNDNQAKEGSSLALAGTAMLAATPAPIKAVGNTTKLLKEIVKTDANKITQLEFEFSKDVRGISVQQAKNLTTISKGKYAPIEYSGSVNIEGKIKNVSRKIYARNDIDLELVDPKTGLTNLQRMQKGYSPIGSDGLKVNLHHLLQQESGPMVELLESQHHKFSKALHGLVRDGESFRNDPILKRQYEKFRADYWRWRASSIHK